MGLLSENKLNRDEGVDACRERDTARSNRRRTLAIRQKFQYTNKRLWLIRPESESPTLRFFLPRRL